jgi:precorrin-8X/cobalt-precorrin-8 methylmutase
MTTANGAYLRDGEEIYRRSFAIIRAEAGLSRFTEAEERIAVRIIHACGQVEVAPDIVFHPRFAAAASEALKAGAPIFCDSQMVAHGITLARLPAGNKVVCTLGLHEVPALAARLGTTRTAAAVEFWKPDLKGAVAVIGNAPTALFRLLEMLDEGIEGPAVIIGMPVGFVGAAESKEALIAANKVPYAAIRGRKGGSAMAAAAVNAAASPRE